MAKISSFQTNPILLEVLNFLQVWGYLAAFVSDFDIRVSDFLSEYLCGEYFPQKPPE
jgi:hypothetical protein